MDFRRCLVHALCAMVCARSIATDMSALSANEYSETPINNTAGNTNGTVVYENTRTSTGLVSPLGVGVFLADDLTTTQPFGCEMTSYELLVMGAGGGTFDVHVELWNADPCFGGVLIQGTESDWIALGADNTPHTLTKSFSTPVGIPGIVWMRVDFSTDTSGWVIAEQAETGQTGNFFSLERTATGLCSLFFFGPGPPFPYAGFWATLTCDLPPPPTGACCNEVQCQEVPESECTGIWRGPGTTCTPNPCAPTYLGYDNRFLTGTFLPIAFGTQVADDIRLNPGALPCELAQYELSVTGTLGTPSFAATLELWTNDPGPDGIISIDDRPALPIPGTRAAFAGIQSDQHTQRLTTPALPAGIALPAKFWIVVATSTGSSGPVTAGLGDIGTSEDGYARNAGTWEPGLNFGGFSPTSCPGGAECTPAGSFRTRFFCYGETARGACCDGDSFLCTADALRDQCDGRWSFNRPCIPDPFDPPCRIPFCPSEGAVTFIDPPDGIIDARQPHPISDNVPRQGIQVITVQASAGADATCFSLCETDVDGFPNGVAAVFESPPGTYTIILDRAISPSAVTTLTYDGNGATGTFVFHPGNVNGDSVVDAIDITTAVDCMDHLANAQTCAAATPYHLDMNHSGEGNVLDLVRLIDLLNGAGELSRMVGSPLPQGPCP